MSASLSPAFLRDLALVYASLRPRGLSSQFVSDLARVYASLPLASESNLLALANHLASWRKVTQEFVRSRLVEVSDHDPLRCPIQVMASSTRTSAPSRMIARPRIPCSRKTGSRCCVIRTSSETWRMTRVMSEHPFSSQCDYSSGASRSQDPAASNNK